MREPQARKWEEYRSLQELKDYFVATLSEEFTTHLARTRAHLKFLEKSLDTQKLQGYLKKLFTDADESFAQMEERLRLLIDYREMFGPGDDHGRDLIFLHELVHKAAESLQAELQKRKILLRLTLNPQLGPIKSDKEKLLQVFFHLLRIMADNSEPGDVLEVTGTLEEKHLCFEFFSHAFPSLEPDYLGAMGVREGGQQGNPPKKNLDVTIARHLVEDCAGTLEPIYREHHQAGALMRLPRNYRLPSEVIEEIRSRWKVRRLLED